MKNFALITIITCVILGGRTSVAKMPEDLTCLTYQLQQSTDELKGQKPDIQDWIKRVVTVENSVLFLHKLSKAEKSKIFGHYLFTIENDPSYVSDIARFIDHICMTKISDSERKWLADNLKREVGLVPN